MKSSVLRLVMTPFDTIVLQVNGSARDVLSSVSVAELLSELGLAEQAVAVEVNGDLVPKRCHAEHLLKAGDEVELVTLVGGG